MSLTSVHITTEIYYACTLHALSVEKEEVMGLLLGRFDNYEKAYITSIIPLQRADKRKDRVEISTEQLHEAMIKTSELSDAMGESLNIVGWYHSHPHITVQPSAVDLRTQGNYQTMDERFVGLIFSVFNEDNKHFNQEMQVTCFQYDGSEKLEIPLIIEKKRKVSLPCLEAIYKLPKILSEEDLHAYTEICKKSKRDLLATLQNNAAFVGSQCHLLRTMVNPLIMDLECRIRSTQEKCNQLTGEVKMLRAAADKKNLALGSLMEANLK